MASNSTVRLCKQQCLCTGCEHQCKESLLNMTIAGLQTYSYRHPLRCVHASFEACVGKSYLILIVGLNCELLVLKPITAWKPLRELIAWCHDHLSLRQTSEELAGPRCFVCATTIELSQLKECLEQPRQVPFACGHAALTHAALRLVFTVASVRCLRDSPAKWNFHFLVCKWVSPSAFYLIFIYSVYVTGTMHINQHLSLHIAVNVPSRPPPRCRYQPPPPITVLQHSSNQRISTVILMSEIAYEGESVSDGAPDD